MFKKGDTVRIARVIHDDGSCAHFVGRVGTISGVGETYVTVKGIGEPADKSWGFDFEEVEPA